MTDEQLESFRQEAFTYLKSNPTQPFYYQIVGDTLVLGVNHLDAAITIYHTKIQDYSSLRMEMQPVWVDWVDELREVLDRNEAEAEYYEALHRAAEHLPYTDE